ncbi:MAG: ISAs1 family transposase [Flavobacteriales bacterium]|nr:ISAs1 family transposase [Flavobacteriales bacterium]
MISAWSHQNQLVLGQLQSGWQDQRDQAIPALLEMLDLKGAVVSIDAMGCQKKIAALIKERKADYLLGLKENQPELLEGRPCLRPSQDPQPRPAGHQRPWSRGNTDARSDRRSHVLSMRRIGPACVHWCASRPSPTG